MTNCRYHRFMSAAPAAGTKLAGFTPEKPTRSEKPALATAGSGWPHIAMTMSKRVACICKLNPTSKTVTKATSWS